jgi:hypothetical protein
MIDRVITWNDEGRYGSTPAGHRIFVLRNKETKTRVVQVIQPPGGRILERVVAVEGDEGCADEARRLVELPL